MHRVTSITHRLGKGVRGTVHSGNWRSDIGEQSVAVKLCFLRDPPSASCHADLEMLWCQRVSKADMRMQNVMHVYDAFWVPMDEFEQHRQRFRPHLNKIGSTTNGNTPIKCAVTIAQHLDGAIVMDWRQDAHSQQEWASLLWQCLACQLQLNFLFKAVHADQTIKNVMSAAVPMDSYVTYRLQMKGQPVVAHVPTYGHLWKAIDLASLESVHELPSARVQQRMLAPLQYIKPSPNVRQPGQAAPAAAEAMVVAAKAAAKAAGREAGRGATGREEGPVEAVKAAMAVVLQHAAWERPGGSELAVVEL